MFFIYKSNLRNIIPVPNRLVKEFARNFFNYTIFAAGRVGFRGRFPWPRKVSVVRREQIRVLIKTAAQTAAQGAAKSAAELSEIDCGAGATEDGERALVRGVNAADGEAGEVPAAVE